MIMPRNNVNFLYTIYLCSYKLHNTRTRAERTWSTVGRRPRGRSRSRRSEKVPRLRRTAGRAAPGKRESVRRLAGRSARLDCRILDAIQRREGTSGGLVFLARRECPPRVERCCAWARGWWVRLVGWGLRWYTGTIRCCESARWVRIWGSSLHFGRIWVSLNVYTTGLQTGVNQTWTAPGTECKFIF